MLEIREEKGTHHYTLRGTEVAEVFVNSYCVPVKREQDHKGLFFGIFEFLVPFVRQNEINMTNACLDRHFVFVYVPLERSSFPNSPQVICECLA